MIGNEMCLKSRLSKFADELDIGYEKREIKNYSKGLSNWVTYDGQHWGMSRLCQ